MGFIDIGLQDFITKLSENSKFSKELRDLQEDSYAKKIPIISRDTADFLKFLLAVKKPKSILEIGCAVGFSALLMAQHAPESLVTTIERYPVMIA
ncbi:MAG: hypothetical protein FWD01_03185, partial [Defluviitaleaceae bacterium]|nr:hypothetical protein [Defluviitaleaceae bacterium]